jgi:Coenzyme PQQ synthesis protein D (PqqD)
MPAQPSERVAATPGGGSVTHPARPRQREGLRTRLLAGEVVILDRRCERIHRLNETAAAIWARCDGRHAVVQIARALAAAFEVDAARAETDVAATIEKLTALGLLEPSALPS